MSDIITIRLSARTPQLKCDSGPMRLVMGSVEQTVSMRPPVARLLGLGASQQVEVKSNRAVLRLQAKSARFQQAVLLGLQTAAADRLPASEPLDAGVFVNVWDDAGVARLRLADNRDPAREADGFVLADFAMDTVATFYIGGDNFALEGLVPGRDCWLGQAGAVIQAPLDNDDPLNAGKISQFLGKSISATAMQFHRVHAIGIA